MAKMGRPRGANNKEYNYTLRLDANTRKRLEAYSRKVNVSKSKIIREAIDAYLPVRADETSVEGFAYNYINNDRELDFAIFCVENIAKAIGMDTAKTYELLAKKSDIMQSYIVPNFEMLHTQGKDYIVDDIKSVMAERGVLN